MSRRREEESSLELLLDTMCNTFGGVMFIAISLAVIVAGRNAATRVQQSVPESRIEDVRKLEEEIAALEVTLSRNAARERDQQRLREAMEQDERLKLLGEIALLEEKLKGVELKTQLREEKAKLTETAKLSILLEIEKLKQQLLQLSSVKNELSRKLSDEKEETEKLRREIRMTAPKELTFHVLTERQEMPFFIVLHEDGCWLLGPRNSASGWEGADDVEMQQDPLSLHFRIRPERKRAFVSGEGISAEFLSLLGQLEKDRIPKFVIDKSAAKNFFTLRQELKKRGIRHGFSIQDDSRAFHVRLVQNAKYEY